MAKITVKESNITVIKIDDVDFISLTDIAKVKNPNDANGVIANWMRTRNTIEYLGIWEYLYNPNFKPTEFEGFKNEAGANAWGKSIVNEFSDFVQQQYIGIKGFSLQNIWWMKQSYETYKDNEKLLPLLRKIS